MSDTRVPKQSISNGVQNAGRVIRAHFADPTSLKKKFRRAMHLGGLKSTQALSGGPPSRPGAKLPRAYCHNPLCMANGISHRHSFAGCGRAGGGRHAARAALWHEVQGREAAIRISPQAVKAVNRSQHGTSYRYAFPGFCDGYYDTFSDGFLDTFSDGLYHDGECQRCEMCDVACDDDGIPACGCLYR